MSKVTKNLYKIQVNKDGVQQELVFPDLDISDDLQNIAYTNVSNDFQQSQNLVLQPTSNYESTELTGKSTKYNRTSGTFTSGTDSSYFVTSLKDTDNKIVASSNLQVESGSVSAFFEVPNKDGSTSAKLGISFNPTTNLFDAVAPNTSSSSADNAIVTKHYLEEQLENYVPSGSGDVTVSVGTATNDSEGIVLLSDSAGDADSINGGTAVTPKALKNIKSALDSAIGTLSDLSTNNKDSIVNAINEVRSSIGTGGGSIVDATDTTKGIVKLIDTPDSNLDAATGVTAVSPKALYDVKVELENQIVQGGGSIEGAITKPLILEPSNSSINISVLPTILGSAYKNSNTSDSRKHRIFEIALDASFADAQTFISNTDSYTIFPALELSTTYYVRIKDVSISEKESSYSDVVSFTTIGESTISTPEITITNYSGDSNIGRVLNVTLSEFIVSGGVADTHVATSYILRKTNDNTIIWYSLRNKNNLTSIIIDDALTQPNTQYTLSVIFHGEYSDSLTATSDFTTISESEMGIVNTPTLSVEGAPDSVRGNPKLFGSSFTYTTDVADTHQKTDWQILDSTTGLVVWESRNNTINLTEITVTGNILQPETAYTARVRYRGVNYGWSDWTSKNFITDLVLYKVATPTVIEPTSTTDVDTFVIIKGSPFEMEMGNGIHDKSDWILLKSGEEGELYSSRNDPAHKTSSPPDMCAFLEYNSSYTILFRYHELSSDLWSEYATFSFTTTSMEYGIKTPSVVIEKLTEDGKVDFKSTFVASQFEFVGGDDHLEKVDWVIYRKSDGQKIYSEENNKTIAYVLNALLCSQMNVVLKPATEYSLSYRQYAKNFKNWSKSAIIDFTTADTLTYPALEFTMRNKLNPSKLFESGFSISKFNIYVNGELKNDYWSDSINKDLVLSYPGDKIKIELKTPISGSFKEDFPFVTFAGYDGSLKDNLLSIDAPLPPMDLLYKDNTLGGGATNSNAPNISTKYYLYGLCSCCTNLTSIPEDLFLHIGAMSSLSSLGGNAFTYSNISADTSHSLTAYGAFHGCIQLTHLPEFLLKYFPKLVYLGGVGSEGEDVDNTWNYGNSSYDGVNGGLGTGAFEECTNIQTIPANFFQYNHNLQILGGLGGKGGDAEGAVNSSGTVVTGRSGGDGGEGRGAFYGCTSLRELPEGLFKNNFNLQRIGGLGGTGGEAGGCSVYSSNFDIISGTQAPSGRIAGKGGVGYGAFSNCINLTTVNDLFANNKYSYIFDTTQKSNYDSAIMIIGGIGGHGGEAKGGYGYSYQSTTKQGGDGGTGGKGGSAFGAFSGCTNLSYVSPLLLTHFKNISLLTGTGVTPKSYPKSYPEGDNGTYGTGVSSSGMFYNCTNLIVDLTITSPNITSVVNFAANTKEVGTVRVPKDSVTATTFQEDTSDNVNVIEEDFENE